MAWSVATWKNPTYFPNASFYLERFLPRHATAHIRNVGGNWIYDVNLKNTHKIRL